MNFKQHKSIKSKDLGRGRLLFLKYKIDSKGSF